MTERNLVSVETITDIRPIPDADAIEQATVRGWTVVVRKGEFELGDAVLYFEVDSALPLADPRFEFLGSRGTKNINDADYHVLKTAKLRGVFSQGLVLPAADFNTTVPDLAESLGVFKYEPPVPANIAGQIRGQFPVHVAPKTDEERLQNIPDMLASARHYTDLTKWVATEKIDGTSATVYVEFFKDGTSYGGVASRNWDLKFEENNTLWRVATESQIHTHIYDTQRDHPKRKITSIAVQGEVFGEGIQGNPLGMKGQHFRAFSLYINGFEVPRLEWPLWLAEIAVPTHDLTFPGTLEEALAQAERDSLVTPGRKIEGLVWRNTVETHVEVERKSDNPEICSWIRSRASFKVISNRYLLKHDR